jgi:hypothetical protein
MIIKIGFVANSSSCSFTIVNTSKNSKTLWEFIEEVCLYEFKQKSETYLDHNDLPVEFKTLVSDAKNTIFNPRSINMFWWATDSNDAEDPEDVTKILMNMFGNKSKSTENFIVSEVDCDC